MQVPGLGRDLAGDVGRNYGKLDGVFFISEISTEENERNGYAEPKRKYG